MLVLAGWAGSRPTEHPRIPVGQGLCGRAIREGKTVREGDVQSSTEYLACFLDTRSELVVPVRSNGQIVGEIDLDGTQLNEFDESDERFVTEVALRIAPRLDPKRSA